MSHNIGQEVAALEIDIAQQLVAADAPVVALDPRVEPKVYRCDGFATTWCRVSLAEFFWLAEQVTGIPSTSAAPSVRQIRTSADTWRHPSSR